MAPTAQPTPAETPGCQKLDERGNRTCSGRRTNAQTGTAKSPIIIRHTRQSPQPNNSMKVTPAKAPASAARTLPATFRKIREGLDVLMTSVHNDAHHWRRAKRVRYRTERESRRPVDEPG